MQDIERDPIRSLTSLAAPLRFPCLAGLGSKYLAIGSPESLGLISCGAQSDALIECHTLLFGPLKIRDSEPLGIEAAMASDIVCLSSTTEFFVDWIADATHLNILDDGSWSKGMTMLARDCDLTWASPPNSDRSGGHGLLSEVILGTVSGRMADEITSLVI